jgi:hypothetical protein
MIASNRIALSVMQTEGAALPRTHARLAAVMVLASRAVLGMTGTLSLSLAADAALPIAMRAQGPDIGRKAGLVEQAAVTAPEPEPRLVEFALLLPWAAAAGAVLSVETREDSLLLRALPA